MRFVRVVGADPACEPNCPEWLSAEGRIEPGSAPAFAEAINRLGARRLPILIHSPGGSVTDAMAMGKLIRARGLAVVVARTLLRNCSETAPRCPDGPGIAITGGAICASACALVLAGGVERLVGPVPLVGVHQITTVVRETEGLAHVTSTRKFYEPDWADAAVRDYLTAMGVGDPVMALMRKTPAAQRSLAEPRRPLGLASGDAGAGRRRPDPYERRQRRQRPCVRRRSAACRSNAGARGRTARAAHLRDAAYARNCVQLSARRGRGRSGDDGARSGHASGRRSAGLRVAPDADGARRRTAAIADRGRGARPAPSSRASASARRPTTVGLSPSRLAGALAGAWTAEPPIGFKLAEMEGRTAVFDEACR